MKPGDITAANQPPEIVALAKYLAHLAGWGTEPIPKKYQSEASAIRAALHAAGYKILAREPTEAMQKTGSGEMPVIMKYWLEDRTLHADVVARGDPLWVGCEEVFRAMWDAAP
jgi:aspartate aminotransferase-like enzyme